MRTSTDQPASPFLRPHWLGHGLIGVMLSACVWLWATRQIRDAAPPAPPGFRVDVNHADARTLAALPGLGRATAQRIIDDRDRRGRFTSPADLARVHGIGTRTVANFERWIACGPGVATPSTAAVDAQKSGPLHHGPLGEESSSLPAGITP